MFVSRLASVTLAAFIGLAPIAPPEHLHEVTDAAGHHELIAHRHAKLHTGIAEHRDASTTVDHDDSALEMEAAYVATAAYVPVPPAVPANTSRVITADVTRRRPAPFVKPLIHAPPRAPAALRAPPLRVSF